MRDVFRRSQAGGFSRGEKDVTPAKLYFYVSAMRTGTGTRTRTSTAIVSFWNICRSFPTTTCKRPASPMEGSRGDFLKGKLPKDECRLALKRQTASFSPSSNFFQSSTAISPSPWGSLGIHLSNGTTPLCLFLSELFCTDLRLPHLHFSGIY